MSDWGTPPHTSGISAQFITPASRDAQAVTVKSLRGASPVGLRQAVWLP